MLQFLDFETESGADISKTGAWVYTRHPGFRVKCAAINGKLALDYYAPFSQRQALRDLALDPEAVWVAHNAFFERSVWLNYIEPKWDIPTPPIDRWRCSSARAQYFGLPGGLDAAAGSLGLGQKDKNGPKAMRLTGGKTPEQVPEAYDMLYRYCEQDTLLSKAVWEALPQLPSAVEAFVQAVWEADQIINTRGVFVDKRLVSCLIRVAAAARLKGNEEINRLTCGEIKTAGQVKALLNWLASEGLDLPNLQKATVDGALKVPVSRVVERALKIRQEVAQSTSSKFEALQRSLPNDCRLRGAYRVFGAHTHRWKSHGVQLQNLRRDVVDYDTYAPYLLAGPEIACQFINKPLEICGGFIRSCFRAEPGNSLLVVDYASIEQRLLSWVAGDKEKLAQYRQGIDQYLVAASGIYGREITKADKTERTIGKVATLALGYGGGAQAFLHMVDAYQLDMAPVTDRILSTASEAELDRAQEAYERITNSPGKDVVMTADIIKQRWRRDNPLVAGSLRSGGLWKSLEEAALRAVNTGGGETHGVRFRLIQRGRFLEMLTPTGISMYYPYPKIQEEMAPWSDDPEAPPTMVKRIKYLKILDSGAAKEDATYGGKLTENLIQCMSWALTADAIVRLEKAGYKVVMHTHDEVVCEADPEKSLESMIELMRTDKLKGLPLEFSGWKAERYGKE